MARSPSEKQIALVEEITNALNIDFPQSSADFTAKTYHKFIINHIKEMKQIWADNDELDGSWLDDMAGFRILN